MSTSKTASGSKDSAPDKNHFQRFINVLDLSRKLLINILLIIFSIVLLGLFIKNSFKKQLIIQPFKISSSLQDKGYTGEMVTSLFINKIKEIQNTGNSFYHNNISIVTPDGENKVDEFDIAFNNSIFTEIKSLLKFFGNRNSDNANGQLIFVDSILTLQFSFADYSITVTTKNNMDSVLSLAAEATLRYTDPYILAAYYLNSKRYDESLQIAQSILNDDNTDNDGLANHLRGFAYLKKGDTATAKALYMEALKTIKSPWLTYNNLGVIYYNENRFDSARIMFQKEIENSPATYPGYLNYANMLYKIYSDTSQYMERKNLLDSCAYYYKKAIGCKKDEIKLYSALLPVLYDQNDMNEFNDCEKKILEMNSGIYNIYFQLGIAMQRKHANDAAKVFFERTKTLLSDSISKWQVDLRIKSLE
jgi:tetratricopeptide (TPR) repeat protein